MHTAKRSGTFVCFTLIEGGIPFRSWFGFFFSISCDNSNDFNDLLLCVVGVL